MHQQHTQQHISEQQNPQNNNQQPHNPSLLRINVSTQLVQSQQAWNLNENSLCEFFQNYIPLPTTKLTPSQLFSTQHVKLIRTQNKIFFGQIINKKKHGKGIIFSKSGKVYQGDFYNNDKQGYATEIYSNGNLYIGEFSQNKKHGKGTFYWFSLYTDNSYFEQYNGDWWGGLPDGHGQHQKSNGDYYVGKFKNGLKHGEGFQSYNNGDKYKGQFVNGLPEGYGQYNWSDGSSYKGDFKQGYRNGYGIWRNGTNSKEYYKGHYVLDKKHGYGIYDWGNGYSYKGNFMDDLRSGQGDLYFQNDLVYSGYWQNGQKNEDYKPTNQQQQGKLQENQEINKKKSNVSINNLNKVNKQRGFSSVQRKQQNHTSYNVSFKHEEPRVCRRRNCFACQYKYSQQKLHSSSVSKIKKN